LFTPAELRKINLSQIGKLWKEYCLNNPYDFEYHVELAEMLDSVGKLPSGFMAVPPHTGNEWVWGDVSRMHTLNTSQTKRKQEKHVCPLQFDIIDRAVTRYSNKGELVFDPFGGIMSTPYRCILKLDRKAIATELNAAYYKDGVKYCKEAEIQGKVPHLFDVIEEGAAA
jgi:DNA modification methylase